VTGEEKDEMLRALSEEEQKTEEDESLIQEGA
jgi:hypothetical protein